MRKITIILLAIGLTGLFMPLEAGAQGKKMDPAVYKEVIEQDLNQKTKLVGTFDLYDDETRRVFNLRMIQIMDPVDEKGKIRVPVKFRDTASGDTILVDAHLKNGGNKMQVEEWKIVGIEALADQVERKEEYTDAEIRQAMLDYVKQQTEWSDYLLLFDPKKEDMRKLNFESLDEKVRRFGILGIATATFTDVDTKDSLLVDMRVKNKKGVLEVDSMKIQKVRKPKTQE